MMQEKITRVNITNSFLWQSDTAVLIPFLGPFINEMQDWRMPAEFYNLNCLLFNFVFHEIHESRK
jgi:hypothetical protein